MKYFSAEEKQIINKIMTIGQSDNAVLTNIFADIIYNHGIAIDLEKGAILYDYETYKGNISSLFAFQRIIIQRALLVKYLEENNYIYIINEAREVVVVPPVGDEIAHPVTQLLPTDIADVLRRTLYRIYVDNSLWDFAAKGYKTTDDIVIENAEKQTNNSKKAVCFAFFTMLFSILGPIGIAWFNGDKQFHKESIDSLNNISTTIQEVSANEVNGIDSLNTTAIEIMQRQTDEIQILNKQNSKIDKLNNKIQQTR